MKRRDWLAVTAGLVLAGRGSAMAPGDRVVWPTGVSLLDGSPWTPLPGHAQLIVRWATWCGYCRRHNVHVDTLHRSLGDAPLQVLGVAADRDADLVRRSLQAQGLQFPVTLDAQAFAGLSARRVVPLTITVDRSGRLREVIPGEMAADDVMALAQLAR
jgi:thiol-disulfide isomerase/thioredoxin